MVGEGQGDKQAASTDSTMNETGVPQDPAVEQPGQGQQAGPQQAGPQQAGPQQAGQQQAGPQQASWPSVLYLQEEYKKVMTPTSGSLTGLQ